jgi:alpha-1,6-mannosyltransferase
VKDYAGAAGLRTFTAICGCGMALIALSLLARHAQWRDDFDLFVPVALVQSFVYALGAWMLLRVERPNGPILLAIIIAVAVSMRLIALATPPNFLSTDVYRYVWDGRLQGAGINPYLYVPADPVLESLRDEGIYSHINRLYTAPTIYAPFAQLVFFAVTRLAESVTAMRLAMLGFEAMAVLALAALLERFGLPRHRLALYLWHPLPVWEFACGTHVDAVLMAGAFAALLAASSGRRGLSGALLAAATLTKFLPLVIAPALYRRWDWRMPAAFLAVIAALYAAYALYGGVGWRVLGYLPGCASEEGLVAGDGVFILSLLRQAGLAPLAAKLGFSAIALAVVGTLTIRALSRDRDARAMLALAAGLATATIVLISPHYPWYFCWLVAFIPFLPRLSLIYLTSSVFYLYITENPASIWTGLVIYGPFLALLALERGHLLTPRLQEGSIA